MFDPATVILLAAVPIGLAYEDLMRRRDARIALQEACHHDFERVPVNLGMSGSPQHYQLVCRRCKKQEPYRGR